MLTGIVNSTSFNNAKQRLIKFIGWCKNDVKNPPECMPYGVDSNPIKNIVAIYIQNPSGQLVVVGYLNVNQMADTGEFRTYATDSDGNLKGSIWLKNTGEIDILATGTPKKIKLNSGSSKAVLGDKLTTVLNDISGLLTSINTWGSTVTPPLVLPVSGPGSIAQLILDINQIQSQNVSLD